MKKIFTTFLGICGMYIVAAQAPEIEWERSLGGAEEDFGYSVQQTADGGYIIAGTTWSNNGDVSGNHGKTDAWVVKLDSDSNIQWQKSFGGSENDSANSILQTMDGGYIFAGSTASNNGDVVGWHEGYSTGVPFSDVWVVKLDASGNIQWQKPLGGSRADSANSIKQTDDGGYVLAGSSWSNDGDVSGHHGTSPGVTDCWIVKLDVSGNIQWQKSLGGTNADFANDVEQTTDGGYIIAGHSASNDEDVSGNHGSVDCWVVKLDASGSILWQKSIGGTGEDYAISVKQTIDGNYVVTGHSASNNGDISGNHGDKDILVLKLDTSGNILWQKSFGGTQGDYARAVQQTIDGGYVVVGYTFSNNGDVSGHHGGFGPDIWIIKLNSVGNIQWSKTLGGTGYDYGYSIQLTDDNGFIVVGFSDSNDGDASGALGYNDFWIVKLYSENMSINDQQFSQLEIFPNPTKDVVYFSKFIDGELFDISGKKVMTIKNAKSVNVSALTKGVFMLKTSEGITKKIVVK